MAAEILELTEKIKDLTEEADKLKDKNKGD